MSDKRDQRGKDGYLLEVHLVVMSVLPGVVVDVQEELSLELYSNLSSNLKNVCF